MDQVKEFLRQCVKYRFWIAFGVSMILPMIGFFVGSGAITEAKTKREGEIKSAKGDIGKFTTPGLPNAQYKPEVDKKTEVLTKDVDDTWRKLYALQEPLLKWPELVEAKFRAWGRKWPENVDRGQVQQAIVDYSIAYPDFVARVYQIFKPWNPEDGTGIVLAPDQASLLRPAPFTAENPPDMGKLWAEQERIWVTSALLDVVAKVNDGVKAKDWDTAIIKQIVSMDVGTATSEDQKSLAKGVLLEPAPPITPEGGAAPPPAAAAPPGSPSSGDMSGMQGGGMGGVASKGEGVFYLAGQAGQKVPYTILPIKMTVLLDQARLPDFLVGLENSPMAIQVMETEFAKPATPVTKPVYGETTGMGMGMGMGASGPMSSAMMSSGMMRPPGGASAPGGPRGMSSGDMMSMMGGGGRSGPPAAVAKGTDLRGVDKAAERKKKQKEAAKGKSAPKKNVDQYFNIIEVTVYGQARFYNTPPAPPAAEPSKSADLPKAEAPKAEPPKAVEPAKKDEAPTADAPKSTEDAPKAATPAPTPKADEAQPKADTPAPAPKAEAPAPK